MTNFRDACFAHYHCNDLPNTACTFDQNIPKYNASCQCIKGNKPFDPNPRTGLIEGCAPLTDSDKATILGCATRFEIEGAEEWVPEVLHATEYDASYGIDVGTVYVNLGLVGESSDVAIVRLLDEDKNNRKMYTIKWYRRNGQISISESTRTRSFFFDSERDNEVASIEDLDILTRIQTGFVGFWIMYKYDETSRGGLLSVGLNGAPFNSDYALLRWTDTGDAMRNIKYMGFTATSESNVEYGVNCVLLNTAIGVQQNPFVQILPQAPPNFNTFGGNLAPAAAPPSPPQPIASFNNLNQVQPQFSFNSLPTTAPSPSSFQYQTSSPTAQSNRRQQGIVRPGSKPWLLNPNAATELQIVTEPQETIIEPVIRNQYLTKLKRLLPTFFEGIPREEIDHMMAIRRMEKEYEDHETYSDDNVLEVDYSPDHVLERNYQPSEVVPGLNVPGNLQPVDHQTADTLNLDLSTAKSARYDTTTIREMLDSLRT